MWQVQNPCATLPNVSVVVPAHPRCPTTTTLPACPLLRRRWHDLFDRVVGAAAQEAKAKEVTAWKRMGAALQVGEREGEVLALRPVREYEQGQGVCARA